MTTFSKILIKNIVTGIVISAIFIALSTNFLNNQISKAQQQHKTTLSSLLKNYQGDELDYVSSQLKSAFAYDYLIVTNFNRDVITEYNKSNNVKNVLSPLLNIVEPSTYKDNNLGMYISYKLNNDTLFNVYNSLFYFILTVMLLLIFVGSFFTSYITSRANKKLSNQISKQIENGINSSFKQTSDNTSIELPSEFQNLNAVLDELKSFIITKSSINKKLEKTAYIDHLTGLENRSGFVDFFERYAQKHQKNSFGSLFITRCSELSVINQVHGYQEGDRYISQVAKILTKQFGNIDGAHIFRLNGSDFATILPNTTLQVAQTLGKELTGLFNEYQHLIDYDSIAFTGIVKVNFERPIGEMLAIADTSISIAQTRLKNCCYVQQDEIINKMEPAKLGNQNWSNEIDFVIENRNVEILTQIISPSSRNKKIYHEVLSRFTNTEGHTLPTAAFFAMAEKLDKIILIDRLVIEKVILEVQKKNLLTQSFGINLSTRSIHDEHFIIWLERLLLKYNDIAKRLVFEISEYGFEQNIKGSTLFIDMIHRVGAKICVEHFGVGLTSFKFFKDLSPDYIKMDGSYSRDIQNDKNNQYFLRLMIDLAHRIGIKVLAESVETQEEKYTFDEIFIDGCQGYYLGKPEYL